MTYLALFFAYLAGCSTSFAVFWWAVQMPGRAGESLLSALGAVVGALLCLWWRKL